MQCTAGTPVVSGGVDVESRAKGANTHIYSEGNTLAVIASCHNRFRLNKAGVREASLAHRLASAPTRKRTKDGDQWRTVNTTSWRLTEFQHCEQDQQETHMHGIMCAETVKQSVD
ncbi:hypothetical protein CBL_03648 [Carabus blaptoides fortunei]